MSLSNSSREPAANQLLDYSKKNENSDGFATNTAGIPVIYKDAMETIGPKGLTLLEDWNYIDEMAHFNRERIPERVVHAKGAGAFGYFEVTHDISAYTVASPFRVLGKKTPIAVRFSQVTGEMGSADTVRDPRGFAVKFYTEDGIWDLVGNNTPIFFLRDAILFPSFIHILKRNPVTHLRDADMFWDFVSLRPETTHQIMVLYSDRGIPSSYRNMNGYGSNTFSFINAHGQQYYCKFHYKTNQGISNLDPNKAIQLAGQNPDYFISDLYNNIAKGNYPSWTMYVQIMTMEEASTYKFDPFDVTKVWYHADFPLIPVGKIVLNRNPGNYFAEIEQLAFNPANLIPGIGPSPDRMLQGRLFAYGDTHRYRLGTNYQQLPVNSAFRVKNFSRDGAHTIDSQGGAPVYHPNSFGGPDTDPNAKILTHTTAVSGTTGWYDLGKEDNFTQARALYKRVLDKDGRTRLIQNIVDHLKDANEIIQTRAVRNFSQVDEDFGKRINLGLKLYFQTRADV